MTGAWDCRVAPRVMEGVAQQSRTHRRAAIVEQAVERRRRLTAQRFGEFEVAARRRVHAEKSGITFDDQRLQVGEGACLCRLRIAQQGAGSGDRRPQAVGPETGKRTGAEMRTEFALRGFAVEMPVGPPRQHGVRRETRYQAFRYDDLGRANALEGGREFPRGHLTDTEIAARQVDPGQAGELSGHRQGEQQCVAFLVEQCGVGQGAGCNDTGNGALDRPLAGCRVADLLTDDY